MWCCNQPSTFNPLPYNTGKNTFYGTEVPWWSGSYLYHLITFSSFHSPAMISFIYVYISFAHDSTQYSYSSFNVQP